MDDRDLLIVLLAEIGGIGLDDVEELGHHRGDAGEMAGPGFAFEFGAKLRQVNHRLHRLRIHVGDAGRKNEIDACLFQHGAVAGEIAGILVEILVFAKLQRVDEDRYNSDVVLGLGMRNKAEMALMQVAHGRHKTNRMAGAAVGRELVAQCGDRGDDFHDRRPP